VPAEKSGVEATLEFTNGHILNQDFYQAEVTRIWRVTEVTEIGTAGA